jgi:hypothetical protein
MARRALPAVLVLAALVADLSGVHRWALALLLLAVPCAFALALACYGDALEARCGGLRPLLAGLAAVLVVFSAALRSPAVVGGVPHLAVSCVGFAFVLYAAIGLGALVPDDRAVGAMFWLSRNTLSGSNSVFSETSRS